MRGQFVNMQRKTAMTMEDLLEQMVKKVVLECEENHRCGREIERELCFKKSLIE